MWGTQWASRKRIGRRRALSTGKRAWTKSKPAPPTTTRCCRQILPSSRAAPAQTLSSLSLTSAPAVHFPTFSAVCICLTLLHPRESPDKAHPSSPKIEVIRRHRIYCNIRQASIRLPFARVKKTQQIFPYLWNVAHSVRAKNPIQKAVLRRGQAPWSDKTNTHTHTHTHTKSAGKHFAKYTNHAVQSGFCPNLPNEIAEEPEDGVCACKHPTVQELM